MVFTVWGRVGLVDEGRTLASAGHPDDVGRVAAARPLGVIGVDGPAGDGGEGGLDETGLVEGVGVDGGLHARLVAHPQAGVDGRRGGPPVLVQLEAGRPRPGPARAEPSAETVLPLPSRTTLTGQPSRASSMRASYHAPGVTVVARVPSAGPVPPPMIVVMPAARPSSMICGQIRCTWQSMAPAVRILPLPAMISVDGPMTSPGVTPSMMSGLPALPTRHDAAVADPDVGFDHPPVVEDDGAR